MSYASMREEIIRFELLRFRLNPMSLPWYRKESPMCAVLRNNGINLESHGTFKMDISRPQTNRKESPMVKMTQRHIDAICHAELFFDPIFAKVESARMRKHLEDDLLYLSEIKLFIMNCLVSPNLPFARPDNNSHGPDISKSRE